MAIFQVDLGQPVPDFIGAKGDGGGGDNWGYKTYITPVNKPTSSFFLQARCTSSHTTNTVKALKGPETDHCSNKITQLNFCLLESTEGYSTQ